MPTKYSLDTKIAALNLLCRRSMSKGCVYAPYATCGEKNISAPSAPLW